MQCSPIIFNSIMQSGKINVDHERLHESEYFMVRQCFGCLGFGHVKQFCVSKLINCSHCGDKHSYDSFARIRTMSPKLIA